MLKYFRYFQPRSDEKLVEERLTVSVLACKNFLGQGIQKVEKNTFRTHPDGQNSKGFGGQER